MKRLAGALPILMLWALPLAAALALAVAQGAEREGWQALLAHPQLWPSLALALWTGTAGSALALVCALTIAAGLYGSGWWRKLEALAAAGVAVPHLAFALGFGLLLAPSGLLARLVAGGSVPPSWVTTQDPLGLSLIAVLVLKEVPFLLVLTWSALAGEDAAGAIAGQWRAARSLGHGPGSAWLRVVQPQLLSRLAWPLLVVWVYGATTVDVALVTGPTQPPTLPVLLWHDLNDAEPSALARGRAGTILLTGVLTVLALTATALFWATAPRWRRWQAGGPSLLGLPRRSGLILGGGLAGVHGVVLALLILVSVAPRWPYPRLLPETFGMAAWAVVAGEPGPVVTSLAMAAGSAALALAMVLLWFETQPHEADRWLLGLSVAMLALPQLLTGAGLYRFLLEVGLAGTAGGLLLAHLGPVLAYGMIVLAPSYRAFDHRFNVVAAALGASHWRRWLAVKLPLLAAPVATAWAVGFSVSMVQFVPAQLAAAGRFATLPMEAVTRSSGGSRPLVAASALALALPPLMAFAAAALARRPRWR